MKILKKFMAAFIAAALLMTGFNYVPAEAATAPAGMKAVWISFQDIQTYLKGKNQSDFDASFTYICELIRSISLAKATASSLVPITSRSLLTNGL